MLSKLQINNQTIERVDSVRFLGVLLDGFLSWKRHIKYIENNISKDSGLLYKLCCCIKQKNLCIKDPY